MQTQPPIAIIGMACRLPGAEDLESYWRLLIEGRSSIGRMPEERLDRRLHFDPQGKRLGTSYTELAGIVQPPPHDPRRCPIPGELAASCDATHVTFAHVACDAIRQAGWDPHRMPSRRGGVYVGHTRGTVVAGQLIYGTLVRQALEQLRSCAAFTDGDLPPEVLEETIAEVTARVRREMPHRDSQGGPHLDAHFVASLVARTLGFEGPALAVNAACASSLIAMSMGIAALQRGTLECALVGGASHCKLDSLVLFSKAQSASATGSRPFDDAADGLVAAEGYAALLLKRLDAAQRDGDPIQGVIRGVGISSDGKGKSLWAPRREGQVAAIRRAYPADLPLDAVQYVEAHATSTQVGDATELAALDEVFGPLRRGGDKLPIGSAKGNIGHTLETAGMAGLIKAVLAMRHGTIPPAVNLEQLNSKVDWDRLGLTVPRAPLAWPDGNRAAHERASGKIAAPEAPPRCCAINAFGIGGLNVHVVLQNDGASAQQPAAPGEPAIRVLDAPGGIGENGRPADERLAVIGVSALLPGAHSLQQLRAVLDQPESQLRSVSPQRWRADGALDTRQRRPHHAVSDQGGLLSGWEYDWRRHRVPPKQVAAADPLQFMLLDCVESALGAAGLPRENWDRSRAAVLVGTDFLGDFSAELQLAIRLPHLLDQLRHYWRQRDLSDAQIDRLTNEFETAFLQSNPALLDETGSFTTSTLASRITKTFDLMGGAAAVDAGDASSGAMLAVARDWLLRDRCDSIICAAGQRALGLFHYERLSLQRRLRGADGAGYLVPGEGAGALVLRRLADARRDGDPVHAILSAVDVDHRAEPREVSPLADKIGFLGGASGMADLLAELARGGSASRSIAVCGGFDQRYRIALGDAAATEREPAPLAETAGGTRPATVIGAEEAADEVRRIRLGGDSWTAVARSCVTVAETLRQGGDWPPAGHWEASDELRMVLVAGTREEAIERLLLAAERVETPAAREQLAGRGILCRRRSDRRPRVAWVFSGQGSQYGGMLRSLVEQTPSAAETLEQIDATFTSLQLPRWSEIAWQKTDQLGRDVTRTKLAVLGADWLLADQLFRHGLRPTLVSGHSFGEYAALAAADAWSWRDATRAAMARGRAVVDYCRAGGAMICTDADAETVEALCRDVRNRTGGGVYLANHNAPRQAVVGGESGPLDELRRRLDAEGFRVIELPVPRPYHTPLMEQTRAPLGADLAALRLRPATVPVLSSVTNRYEADPRAFRENLIQQMVTPVRYVDLINRLRDDGVDLIVEVGPGEVLTKLHRQILGGTGPLVISTDDRKTGTTAALRRAAAAYELIAPGGSPAAPPSVPSCPADEFAGDPEAAIGSPPHAPVAPVAPVAPGTVAAAPVATLRCTDEARQHLDILELRGTPREMGIAHGRARGAMIWETAQRLADTADWPPSGLSPLGPLADDPRRLFADEDWEELEGLATGSGLDLQTVVACNLYAYPDLSGLGGCSQLAVHDEQRRIIHGANEDLPLALAIEPFRRRMLQWRVPPDGWPHLTFSAAGQLGGIVGMNAAGLALSSAMLLDRPRPHGATPGFLHGMLVRRLLCECDSLEAALHWLRGDRQRPRSRGGWAILLSDGQCAEAVLVEYDGEELQTRWGIDLCTANHCRLLRPSDPQPAHSMRRQQRLDELLRETPSRSGASLEKTRAALRDRFDSRVGRQTAHPTMNTVCRLDNQLSVLMRPATGELWVHAPGKIRGDGYVHLELIGGPAKTAAQSPAGPPTEAVSRPPDAPPASATPTTTVSPTGQPSGHCSVADYRAAVERYQAPAERVCDRFVVRVVDAEPLLAAASPNAVREQPTCWVAGEASARTDLAAALNGSGSARWESLSLAELVARGAELAERGPLQIVLAAPSGDDAAGLGDWFEAVRRLVAIASQHEHAARWTLVALSRLGGDFGSSGNASGPGDTLAGLLKAIAMEFATEQQPVPRLRALDVAPEASAEQIAAAIARITSSELTEVEWGLDHAGRLGVTRILPETPTASAATSRRGGRGSGGCWVITGGARGVTALAAREIAHRFGVTVHLLGSTPLQIEEAWLDLDAAGLDALKRETLRRAAAEGVRPPIAAWHRIERMLEVANNLRELRAEGANAEYHVCDLRDPAAVTACLEQIRGRGEPVVGVLHGAGFERSARLDRKRPEDVARTLAIKLDGLRVLWDATRDDPLEAFVCFGSTAGRFGSVGQADYALANDAMARRMGRLQAERPDCRCVCLHWTAWGDTGMAMRPEVLASLKARGIALMPAKEGVEHLLAELARPDHEAEVVVTDAQRYQQLVGGDRLLGMAAATQRATSPRPAGTNSDGSPRVTGRYLLRLAEVPPVTAPRPQPGTAAAMQRVLLWGDTTWCAALAAQQLRRGADCCALDADEDLTSMTRSLQRFAADGPIDTLLIAPPDDCQNPERAVDRLLQLTQAWVAHLDTAADKQLPLTCVAITRLGGDGGRDGGFGGRPEWAAMAGLVKSLRVELIQRGFARSVCRVLDVAAAEPNGPLLEKLAGLLARRDGGVEWSVTGPAATPRQLVYHQQEFVTTPTTPAAAAPGCIWLVSGGARGITCEVALAVARRFGLELHLLGSSDLETLPEDWFELDEAGREDCKRRVIREHHARHPGEPPIRGWQRLLAAAEVSTNLRRYREAGVSASYHRCDLTEHRDIDRVLHQLDEQEVAISGLIHGAGFEKSADILKKKPAEMRRTLQVKLDALRSLLEGLAEHPLRHVITFGSISGRLGGLGQLDYCLANDAAAKCTTRLRQQRAIAATTFDWHSWDGVGMAVRPETRQLKEKLGFRYMSVVEGVDRVVEELEHGLPEAEVLITTGDHLRRMEPTSARGGGAEPVTRQPADHATEDPAGDHRAAAPRPLLEPLASPQSDDPQAFRIWLYPDRDPFLVQHRFKDRPLMPLVMAAEALLQAGLTVAGPNAAESFLLSNLQIEAPLRFLTDRPVDAEVVVRRGASGYDCQLQSHFTNAAGQRSPKPRVHASAQLPSPSAAVAIPDELIAPLQENELAGMFEVPIRDDLVLYHGPAFRQLRAMGLDGDSAIATVEVPPNERLAGPARRVDDWRTNPAVLDACLFAAGVHLYARREGTIAVPLGIERLVFRRPCPVGERVTVRLRQREITPREASFDFALLDADGEPCLVALGYRAALVVQGTQSRGAHA